MDRALTFFLDLESLRKMLKSRIGFLKQLIRSSWNANATVLPTATLALVHSMAQYCALVWCRIAHTYLIKKPIKDALRIVTRCLCPTLTNNLFILSGIQPTDLCRQKAIIFLVHRAQEPEHLLYERLLSPLRRQLWQLKSRHPFVSATLELLNDAAQSGTSVAQWSKYKRSIWSGEKTPLDSIHLLKMLAQSHRDLTFPDLHGSGLIASEPVLIYSAQK